MSECDNNEDENGIESKRESDINLRCHLAKIGSNQVRLNHGLKVKSHLEEKDDKKEEKKSMNKRIFIPPFQGMDSGQYPKALFNQYYPNRNKSNTFDVLPLPFLDRLNNEGKLTLSMNNKKIKKKWQEFINDLPNSEFQSLTCPNEKFWRWKMYLRYEPNETENDYRYKMNVGPKYDDMGRLPITGEDLQLYRKSRVIKFKPNSDKKYFSKNGHDNMSK